MSLLECAAVLCAGVFAGAINTVVGSGTLVTFPVLLAVGYPPVTANVSNTLGRRNRPHLLEAWGQRFNLQLDEGAHLTLFRYPNRPGMLGRVGSLLGERGINISSATQGVHRTDDDINVVIVVTDADIPDDVMAAVLAEPGVLDGRTLRV